MTSTAERLDTSRIERVARSRAAGKRGRRWFAACLVAGLVAGACEGENLFTGESPELRPRVNNLAVPQTAFAGDTVYVRVDAYAARQIMEVVVALRGAVSRDTTLEVKPPRPQVSQVLAVAVPELLQDTLLIVQASVTDRLGVTSRVREATIVTFGPPAVSNVSAPQIVRAGDPVSVRVQAFGSRRISQIELVATGAIQKDTSVAVFPPRNTVTQDIVLQLPVAATDTLLTFAVVVRDEAGMSSAPVSRVVPLAIDPPTVELTAPATANAGMFLDLSVHATATRRVQEIRIELRGAVLKDSVVQLSPMLTDVRKNVSFLLPANIISSALRVQAIAIDRGGAVAMSDIATLNIPLGPPEVTSLEVPVSVKAGFMVDVRVRARGDRALSRIEVRFRGATDSTRVYQIAPQRVEAIQDAFVTVPLAPPDSVLVVLATATDVAGAVSEIVSQAIGVIIPPPDTTDTSSAAYPSEPAPAPAASEAPAQWSLESSEPVMKAEPAYAFAAGEPFSRRGMRGRRRRTR